MIDGPRSAPDTRCSPDAAIARSRTYCRQVARRKARNFYYGMMLTPPAKRAALYAVYAFMCACDDMADAPADDQPGQTKRTDDAIGAFRQRMRQVLIDGQRPRDDWPEARMWPAFEDAVRRYGIQVEHLNAMLDGQQADMRPTRYATFARTYDYCYKVASTVGLVCLSVWGCRGGAQTRKLAEYRGVALQLTNMLRDLIEDARQGRFYLPAEDFERFGYDPKLLAAGRADAAFDRFMTFQVERARSYYARSAELESQLDAACRPACWAIMRIYRALLETIARHPRRVLRRRVRLGVVSKLWIAFRALCWRPTESR